MTNLASQITDSVFMIEPVAFGFNASTATDNLFQSKPDVSSDHLQELALQEFQDVVVKLRAAGVRVIVISDTLVPHTPDSIFPNNWITTHEDGTVVLYPMFAENRRWERRPEILEILKTEGFIINEVVDISSSENDGHFLEGTGSMILDRPHRIAYTALSQRACRNVLQKFCDTLNYTALPFHAFQTSGGARAIIYHANVMMCVGQDFAAVCLNSVDNPIERMKLVEQLRKTNKDILLLNEKQIKKFAGNMLELRGSGGNRYIVLSQTAYDSLEESQLDFLRNKAKLIPVSLRNIEQAGGGSVRCMIAEVFLPKGACAEFSSNKFTG